MASRYETGWAVLADARNRMEERQGAGARRPRAHRARTVLAAIELPYRRVVIEDEAGRKAWSNPI